MTVPAGLEALAPATLAPGIAAELSLPPAEVESVLGLLAGGAQPAFVVRYRRERAGSLGVGDIEAIGAAAARAAKHEFRREALRRELEGHGQLSPEAAAALDGAQDAADLDDVRQLIRKRRRGLAGRAKAAGLDVLAQRLLAAARSAADAPEEPASPEAMAAEAVGPSFATPEDALEGAGALLIEDWIDDAPLRRALRRIAREQGSFVALAPPEASRAPARESADADADAAAEPTQGAPAEPVPPNVDDVDGVDGVDKVDEPAATAEPPAAAEADVPASEAESAAPAQAEPAETPGPVAAGPVAAGPVAAPAKRKRPGRDAAAAKKAERRQRRWSEWLGRRVPCDAAPPDILALLRAEREGGVSLGLEFPLADAVASLAEQLGVGASGAAAQWVRTVLERALEGPLRKVALAGVRRWAKELADQAAARRYAEVLRAMLMAPAFGPARVLGVDPGHQPGCRLVVVDERGEPLAEDTVFPLGPRLQAPQAKARVLELVKEHGVRAVAVGSGNGGRELGRLAREAVKELGDEAPAVVSVPDDAASLYASSRSGKEAHPNKDPAFRRALAVARRLQDPLAELARVDLRRLGLGHYQHEIDQEELRSSLDQVLGSAASLVGVNVNEASADTLSRIGGLGQALARALVTHREARGPLRTRSQLFDVPGFSGRAFEQFAGFARIPGGEHPLDGTSIHPERYSQVAEVAREAGVPLAEVLGQPERVAVLEAVAGGYLGKPSVSGEPLGPESLRQLLEELANPGRDPRPAFSAADFRPQVESFADLTRGMDLDGIVTHVAAFGVFVDVGLEEDGLVHVSELSHRFVSRPSEAVHVGQRVRVRVLELDPERRRFALSLKALEPRPPRAERPRGEDPRGDQREERHERGDRPRRGPRPLRGPRADAAPDADAAPSGAGGDARSRRPAGAGPGGREGGKGPARGGRSERGGPARGSGRGDGGGPRRDRRPRGPDAEAPKTEPRWNPRGAPREQERPEKLLNFRMDLRGVLARLEDDNGG